MDYLCAVFLIHLGLAILLFFIVNWIGEKTISVGYVTLGLEVKKDETPAFNFLFRVLSPVVYIILLGVLFQTFGYPQGLLHIYLITVYYWVIRLGYVLITNQIKLTNWVRQIFYWVVSIGLSFWVSSIIDQVDQILPEPKILLDQFWILVLLFLYSVFNQINLSNEKSKKRKSSYVISRYGKLKQKYNEIITEYFHNNLYEAMTYSIMIYEDFNRPRVLRWMEYVSFFLTKKPHTLGIMQVTTDKYITDKESLSLAMHRIQEYTKQLLNSESSDFYFKNASFLMSEVASKYNGGSYKHEVALIFENLMSSVYKDTTDKIELSCQIE
jgi:hypothetical protein